MYLERNHTSCWVNESRLDKTELARISAPPKEALIERIAQLPIVWLMGFLSCGLIILTVALATSINAWFFLGFIPSAIAVVGFLIGDTLAEDAAMRYRRNHPAVLEAGVMSMHENLLKYLTDAVNLKFDIRKGAVEKTVRLFDRHVDLVDGFIHDPHLEYLYEVSLDSTQWTYDIREKARATLREAATAVATRMKTAEQERQESEARDIALQTSSQMQALESVIGIVSEEYALADSSDGVPTTGIQCVPVVVEQIPQPAEGSANLR